MKRVVAILTLILLVSCAGFSADKASVIYVEGDVTLNGSPATIGDSVQAGALVTTGPDSVCQIVFNTKNIIHVAQGTVLRFDPKALSRGATLQKGAIALVLRNLQAIQGNELRFGVRTSTAVAGVRGTCFFIAIEDENNTYICSCNGAIHIEGDGGQFTQNIAAPHHREVRVTRTGTAISVNAAPILYHTDEDVEGAAAKIGETVDWTKIDR
jgi:hypothetical protein